MLLYFILGILLAYLGIPILEALSSIVSTWSQYITYVFAFKIYQIKKQIGLDQEQNQDQDEKTVIGFTSTSAIGEQIPNHNFDQDQEEQEQEQDE